jgi:hypothetical protein
LKGHKTTDIAQAKASCRVFTNNTEKRDSTQVAHKVWNWIYAAHWAAVQPASWHAATTALTVAAGQPAFWMHWSYVPRQLQMADGDE